VTPAGLAAAQAPEVAGEPVALAPAALAAGLPPALVVGTDESPAPREKPRRKAPARRRPAPRERGAAKGKGKGKAKAKDRRGAASQRR